MIRSLGRRLSLFFYRGADGGDPPVVSHPGAAVLHPMVDFVAYAEDCILSGRIRLRADRLTDMLNDHEEVHLVDVMVQSILEPEAVEIKEVVVPRDELLLVHATGPRGDLSRRTRTRQTYVTINTAPYVVRGNLHAVPFLDAVAGLPRRGPMVPLTEAVVDYPMAGEWRRQRVATVIVNRRAIDNVSESVEHDGSVPDPLLPDEPDALRPGLVGSVPGGSRDFAS